MEFVKEKLKNVKTHYPIFFVQIEMSFKYYTRKFVSKPFTPFTCISFTANYRVSVNRVKG